MNAKLTAEQAMQAQLDRLAAGELPENDRRSLLAWLDEDAARWRACGLAFLEAQSWQAALADWPGRAESLPVQVPPQSAMAPAPQRAWLKSLLLAAAAAVLFFAGRISLQWAGGAPALVQSAAPAPPVKTGPLMASLPVRTSLGPGVAAQLQIPLAAAHGAPRGPAISDYERKQWEKRGFELREERRYLPARLPDGTTVLVPIDKVHVRLKGTPVS